MDKWVGDRMNKQEKYIYSSMSTYLSKTLNFFANVLFEASAYRNMCSLCCFQLMCQL